MEIRNYKLSISADEYRFKNFIERYHFDEKDTELVSAAVVFVSEIIRVTSAIGYEEQRVICAVTLGEQYDVLVNMAEEAGNLLLSYCLECFGMEMLSKSYEKMNEKVFADSGKWIGDYCFLDMDSPELSGQKGLPAEDGDGKVFRTVLDACGISWRKGMLHPLKSVLFTAAYRTDRAAGECGSCEQCDRLTCTFRQTIQKKIKIKGVENIYSYGIARILENGES
ncbi:MAG: hypothetical protein NC124_15830 [Clostridium sp.]|nr:hypothetical protein [Clostridium sp.]